MRPQGVVEATKESFSYVDAFEYGNDIFEPKNRNPRVRGARVAPLRQGTARLQPGLFYTSGFRLDPALVPFMGVVRPAGEEDAPGRGAGDANDTSSRDREYYRLFYQFDRTLAPPTEILCCRKVTGNDDMAAGKLALRTKRLDRAPLTAAVPVVPLPGDKPRPVEAEFLLRQPPEAADDDAAGDVGVGGAKSPEWLAAKLSCPSQNRVDVHFMLGKERLGDASAFVLHRQPLGDQAGDEPAEHGLDECLCFS